MTTRGKSSKKAASKGTDYEELAIRIGLIIAFAVIAYLTVNFHLLG